MPNRKWELWNGSKGSVKFQPLIGKARIIKTGKLAAIKMINMEDGFNIILSLIFQERIFRIFKMKLPCSNNANMCDICSFWICFQLCYHFNCFVWRLSTNDPFLQFPGKHCCLLRKLHESQNYVDLYGILRWRLGCRHVCRSEDFCLLCFSHPTTH